MHYHDIRQVLADVSQAILPRENAQGNLTLSQIRSLQKLIQKLEVNCQNALWLNPVLTTYRHNFTEFRYEDLRRFGRNFSLLWDLGLFEQPVNPIPCSKERRDWLPVVRNDVYLAVALCLCLPVNGIYRKAIKHLLQVADSLQEQKEHILPYLLHTSGITSTLLVIKAEIITMEAQKDGIKQIIKFIDGMSTSPNMFSYLLTKIMNRLHLITNKNKETHWIPISATSMASQPSATFHQLGPSS